MSADWRALCEELVEALEIQLDELRFDDRLCKRARSLLAQPEPEGRPAPAPAGAPRITCLPGSRLQPRNHRCTQGRRGGRIELLPEDAQIIEPTERTILVPARVPVEVSERPWEREGWCNEKGECWGNWLRTWKVCNPRILDPKSSVLLLPFNSLPLPSGEVEP